MNPFLAGIGYGLIYAPSITVVGVYFKERFALAMSLASAGICIGYMVFPPMVAFLISNYGWRGTFLIGSACYLNLFVSACTFRPIASKPQNLGKSNDKVKAELHEFRQEDSGPESESQRAEGGTATRNSCKAISTSTGIPDLCYSPHYPISLFTAFTVGGLYCINIHIAARVVEHGYSKSQGATVLSLIGVGSLAGRFVHGILIDLKYASTQTVFLASLATCAISLLSSPLTSNLVLISIFGFIFGMSTGILAPLSYVIAREVSSPHLLAQVIGYMVMTYSGGNTIGAVFGGRLITIVSCIYLLVETYESL